MTVIVLIMAMALAVLLMKLLSMLLVMAKGAAMRVMMLEKLSSVSWNLTALLSFSALSMRS